MISVEEGKKRREHVLGFLLKVQSSGFTYPLQSIPTNPTHGRINELLKYVMFTEATSRFVDPPQI